MRKDSETLLKIVVDARNELNNDNLTFHIDEFASIPNIRMNIGSILNDLKLHNYISEASSFYLAGNMSIYLTLDGITYFEDKEKKSSNTSTSYTGNSIPNNYFNNYGNAFVNQNNKNNMEEFDKLVKEILENISDLSKENEEAIKDVVEMVQEELKKSEPKISRFKSALTLITPLVTIAKAAPVLVDNLNKLANFIMAQIN